uniref:Tc1-like transposase DDE domain-containing protein n=1 Tax=Magnetococcus massalia (strain MO-1) TaxID=451514 RepID=A0A1S7LCL6_MAGMO|nr:protein of unknown function [Candidatus Magnetococcus massalia]
MVMSYCPLPPYSPDFNPIEESFAILKKRRLGGAQSLSVDELLSCNTGLD